MDNAQGLDALRRALKNPAAGFRSGQWEALDRLVNRRERLLLVQRTGWGKSMVYFLATRFLRQSGSGPTLLISPLLSLMRDQIRAASELEIRAATINSENRDLWDEILAKIARNAIDILLVAPERLASEMFHREVITPLAGKIGLFAVDEAHCISDWGHDFRPDYRRIKAIMQSLPPQIPLLATTATATDRVIADIVEQFGGKIDVMRGALKRETLRLQNIKLRDPAARMAWLADNLESLPGSGIVYTLTKHDAERIADFLKQKGIAAAAYHSEIDPRNAGLRSELENRLLNNELKALIATPALGMGFDKPDLGFVIHYQAPGSVVHYYQQVGRAGRSSEAAYGLLFQGIEDNDILDYFQDSALPEPRVMQEVLTVLEQNPEGLSIGQLQKHVNAHFGELERALKLLTTELPAPVVRSGRIFRRTGVTFKPDFTHKDRLDRIRTVERQTMQRYFESRECLMQFLVRELNDPAAAACGVCANCRKEALVPITYSRQSLQDAQTFLNRLEMPLLPRKMAPAGVLTNYDLTGSKIPEEWRNEVGRILCRWGDPGLGELVYHGKYKRGKFDERLIDASAELIRERWHPDPFPEWGTSIPSNRHPELVKDLAVRLCKKLSIPYGKNYLQKVRETPPQKEMQNSYYQAQNLAGAFRVRDLKRAAGRAVLLIDDMVDSGWTMTIAGLELKRAGAGPVYPFVLARTTRTDDR